MRLRNSVVPVIAVLLAGGFAVQAQTQERTVTCPTLQKAPDKLSLRFYWASWCEPCRQMMPLVDGTSNVVRVEKIDFDANAKAVAQAGVKSIPMIVFWQDGKAVASKVGGVGQKGLCDWIAKVTGQDAQPAAAAPPPPAEGG